MSAWDIAIGNVQRSADSGYTMTRAACLWCGNVLPANRPKYCNKDCTRRHHNFLRPTTRAGRRA